MSNSSPPTSLSSDVATNTVYEMLAGASPFLEVVQIASVPLNLTLSKDELICLDTTSRDHDVYILYTIFASLLSYSIVCASTYYLLGLHSDMRSIHFFLISLIFTISMILISWIEIFYDATQEERSLSKQRQDSPSLTLLHPPVASSDSLMSLSALDFICIFLFYLCHPFGLPLSSLLPFCLAIAFLYCLHVTHEWSYMATIGGDVYQYLLLSLVGLQWSYALTHHSALTFAAMNSWIMALSSSLCVLFYLMSDYVHHFKTFRWMTIANIFVNIFAIVFYLKYLMSDRRHLIADWETRTIEGIINHLTEVQDNRGADFGRSLSQKDLSQTKSVEKRMTRSFSSPLLLPRTLLGEPITTLDLEGPNLCEPRNSASRERSLTSLPSPLQFHDTGVYDHASFSLPSSEASLLHSDETRSSPSLSPTDSSSHSTANILDHISLSNGLVKTANALFKLFLMSTYGRISGYFVSILRFFPFALLKDSLKHKKSTTMLPSLSQKMKLEMIGFLAGWVQMLEAREKRSDEIDSHVATELLEEFICFIQALPCKN